MRNRTALRPPSTVPRPPQPPALLSRRFAPPCATQPPSETSSDEPSFAPLTRTSCAWARHERRAVLDWAIEVASGTGVPVSGRLFVAPSVARGVLAAVDGCDCDALLVGWRERSHEGSTLGSDVDRIVRRADCDVLVEKIGAVADGVTAVLLPVADSPHADLAARVARAIAASNDARVDLLRVVESADEIVAASRERDVTVLGATRTGPVRRRVVGSVPRAVGQRAQGTVIMARTGGGSLLSRVFRL